MKRAVRFSLRLDTRSSGVSPPPVASEASAGWSFRRLRRPLALAARRAAA